MGQYRGKPSLSGRRRRANGEDQKLKILRTQAGTSPGLEA
jgi:hypothetical protein